MLYEVITMRKNRAAVKPGKVMNEDPAVCCDVDSGHCAKSTKVSTLPPIAQLFTRNTFRNNFV